MYYNSLKLRAKEFCAKSRPSIVAAGALYYILSLVVTNLSANLVGIRVNANEAQQFMKAYNSGDFDFALALAGRFLDRAPSGGAYFINAALQIVLVIVSFGFVIMIMNTVRLRQASYGNLLDGFGMFIKIILLNLIEAFLIGIQGLLFVVPGVIAAYRYRMAKYILIDHPEMSPLQCIRASKQMMKGHKAELFWLDFSLLGWSLLGALVPLVSVWTIPYKQTIFVLYYDNLMPPAVNESYDAYADFTP